MEETPRKRTANHTVAEEEKRQVTGFKFHRRGSKGIKNTRLAT
jgi:hypothetical protein